MSTRVWRWRAEQYITMFHLFFEKNCFIKTDFIPSTENVGTKDTFTHLHKMKDLLGWLEPSFSIRLPFSLSDCPATVSLVSVVLSELILHDEEWRPIADSQESDRLKIIKVKSQGRVNFPTSIFDALLFRFLFSLKKVSSQNYELWESNFAKSYLYSAWITTTQLKPDFLTIKCTVYNTYQILTGKDPRYRHLFLGEL